MIGGIVYFAIFALACAPGLPIGWRLFGRSPAGWISGALIGYALTAIVIWAAIALGVPGGLAFVAGWALLLCVTWMACRGAGAPLLPLAPWGRGDALALALVLALTAAVALPPFANLGIRDAEGNRYYRAYFTADFVWHTALTAELGKYAMPPRNPFLAPRPIHYYWTYFLLPAAVSASGPAALRDVQRCLKLNAFFTGMLLMSAIFMSVRGAVPHAAAAGMSVALALLASSAEGLATVFGLWQRGMPLSAVRDINIDAVTAWVWKGYRIDGLQRALWYVPQHSMAYALGLIALTATAVGGSPGSLASSLLIGVALGGAVTMNPLVGGMFALAFGVAVLADAARKPAPLGRILCGAAAALPVVAAVMWCLSNRMVEGAGGALEFGFTGTSRNAPVLTLLLSLGPILLPALAGLLVRCAVPVAPLAASAALAGLSLFLLYFVRLSVDRAWVGFRAGHLMLVSLPALAARFFACTLGSARTLALASFAALLIAGAPTVLIDEYNAQDITNRSIAPGDFPWTLVLTAEQQQAFRWIREHTPPTAVVQMEPLVRGRAGFSLIPTFAERRMAAGLALPLLEIPEYRERSERARTVYASNDARDAWDTARALRLDYLYVDDVERRAYPGVEKLDRNPQYFEPVFAAGPVAVYRVR